MDFKKILTFSFDDGVKQDERFIEILNKYGLKCTFNLNSELLGKDGYLTIKGKKIEHNKVAPDKVKALYKGHEVASHTLTHPNITTLAPSEVVRQVEMDRINLSNIVGYEVKGFAYPCGGINSNRVVADLIKNNSGIEYARTIVHSYGFAPQDDMFLFKPSLSLTKNKQQLLDMADEFLNSETEDLKLFYIWGHSYELDIDDSWDYFEDVCKMLSNKKDVMYCTNKEAFDYINKIK
ncbi:MAG: polysaccharide deacetylase family protein [Clostridia bacterium]|nr:polysaccharide deacetylase family protein [Clostridia bacterium]